jgi:integrase
VARRRGLTDRQIAALPRKTKRYVIADPDQRSLFLRVPARDGPIGFTVIVKKGGRQTWESIGTTDDLTIEEARERALVAIKRIKRGELRPQPPQSVAAVAQSWLERHVAKSKLRSERELRRIVGTCIVPRIGNADFVRLRRSDIVAFLDAIEDKHGPATADAVLSTLRSIASWVQRRSDDYVPPFARGMRRVPAAKRERSRVLSDDELRIVLQAADNAGLLGDIIKLLLLTAQRREKVYKLKWSDISPDGVWTIAAEPGEKGNGGRLRLPPLALAIINNQARIADFVFPHRPSTTTKARFNRQCGINFRLHDLRRTSRTLLSRIGVSFEVAEAILGHKAKGVAAVYDRHSYEAEKGIALGRLAATIQQIVDPTDNVVAFEAVR